MDIERAVDLFINAGDYEASRAVILAALSRHPSLLIALRERRRQIERFGPGAEVSRAQSAAMTMTRGAICFLQHAVLQSRGGGVSRGVPPPEWPWAAETWNPPLTKEDALVKAMALLVGELDGILMARGEEAAEARLAAQA